MIQMSVQTVVTNRVRMDRAALRTVATPAPRPAASRVTRGDWYAVATLGGMVAVAFGTAAAALLSPLAVVIGAAGACLAFVSVVEAGFSPGS